MISVAAILEQLDLYAGWTYSRDDPRYPVSLPGIRLPSSPPNQTNCCAFVEGLIVGAAAATIDGFDWGMSAHRRAMIWYSGDKFSPAGVLVGAGLATHHATHAQTPPPVWSVCQGWRGKRGHTFIIGAVDGDKVLILEANHARGLNGVGWRSVGGLTSSRVPDGWQGAKDVWTWRRVLKAYPEIAVAALRVDAADDPIADLAEPSIDDKPEGSW